MACHDRDVPGADPLDLLIALAAHGIKSAAQAASEFQMSTLAVKAMDGGGGE
jgi:hypothetical protein